MFKKFSLKMSLLLQVKIRQCSLEEPSIALQLAFFQNYSQKKTIEMDVGHRSSSVLSLESSNDLVKNQRSYQNFVLPDQVVFLVDNQKAIDLVDSIRWKAGHFCPRCRSKFVKRVNTNVFRDLNRCIDCGYMFNALSGTIFQGAKIKMVRFFQLLSLENAMKDDLGVRDVCFALDVSHKTAVSLIRRIRTVQPMIDFSIRSKVLHCKLRELRVEPHADIDPAYRNYLAYCEMNGIVVLEESFAGHLASFL